MIRALAILLPLLAWPGALLAQAKDAPAQQPGMLIKSDQEAPLVLFIVPWQEAKLPPLPWAPAQILLPPVLDYERSLVDDPLNRPVAPEPGPPAGR